VEPIIVGDVLPVGTEDRLIRIVEMERPIDVFCIPNQLEAVDFQGVFSTFVGRRQRSCRFLTRVVL
jgi:hypothetical protein